MIASVGDIIRVENDSLYSGPYESVVLTAIKDEYGEYYGVEVPITECGCFAYEPKCDECYWSSSATTVLHTITLVSRAEPGYADLVRAHVAEQTAKGVHIFHA